MSTTITKGSPITNHWCRVFHRGVGRDAGVGRNRGVGVPQGVSVGVAVGVDGGVVVGVEVGVNVADGIGEGVIDGSEGVGLAVGVGNTVALGVGVAVGVGRSQIIWTVSNLQPSLEVLLSLPIRHRITMVCPPKAVRSTSVSVKPPELPVHAWRPASGLPQQVLIVPM